MTHDAIVIGGGFYGTAIACYLRELRGFNTVLLVERQAELFGRASYNNQARVHNGYHYPRSFTTAFRSRVNLPRFVRDFSGTVKRDFTKLYAIARMSKVTARQFERFCQEIQAHLEPAHHSLRDLFNHRLIEAVYRVEEPVFDAALLAAHASARLRENGIEVRLQTRAEAIVRDASGTLTVALRSTQDQGQQTATSQYVFNASYSGINQLGGAFPGTHLRLKHEIAEMALVQLPEPLRSLGVTVMDGPFFSLMPFPARGLQTLSHVRYTPHTHWSDQPDCDPYQKLAQYPRVSRVDRMLRDATRYMPSLAQATCVDSLWEVKTVLVKNESDDGRPILFEKHAQMHNCFSILGGKIDNIYDILEKLDSEPLPLGPQRDLGAVTEQVVLSLGSVCLRGGSQALDFASRLAAPPRNHSIDLICLSSLDT